MSSLSVYHVSSPELPNKVLTHFEDIVSTLAEQGVVFDRLPTTTPIRPGASQDDGNYVFAYAVASLMEETLKRCGDTLTRENLMKQATSFKKYRVPLLLPGITVSTSPTDYYPIQSVKLARFKGETWELFGDIMSAEGS